MDYFGNLLANPQAMPQAPRGGGGGPSSNTSGLLSQITQRAGGNDPLSEASRNALGQAVGGFGNPWMDQAASSFNQFQQQGVGPMGQTTFNFANGLRNDQLDQTVSALMAAYLPGGSGEGTMFGGGGGRGGGGSWKGGGGGDGGSSSSWMKPYITGILGGNLPPGLQQLMDSAAGATTEEYQQGLAGLSASAESAGRFGSSAHQLADAQASQRYAQALADQQASMRLEPWQQAMALGTSLDQTMIGADASRANAATSAGASYGAQMAQLGLQEQLANRGMLLDALGAQNQMSLGGLGAMTTLSGIESNNQQFGLQGLLQGGQQFDARQLGALGLANQWTNDEFGQLMSAFGASNGLDQQGSAARNRAYQQQMDQYNQLWRNGLMFTDGLNGLTSQFAPTYSTGSATNPGQYQDPWRQAAAGGLAGWAAADRYRDTSGN